MVSGIRPSANDISSNVFGNLRLRSDLSPAIAPEMKFEPSLGVIASRIDKLSMDIRSFRKPLEMAVREVVIPSIRANFDAQGRPSWAPLAPDTLHQRKFQGRAPGPILRRSGTLRGVATQLNIWTFTRQSATIRDLPEKAWYGKVHQAGADFGGKSGMAAFITNPITGKKTAVPNLSGRSGEIASEGGGSIPARPFFMLHDEDKAAIYEIFIKWLDERVALAWGGVTV